MGVAFKDLRILMKHPNIVRNSESGRFLFFSSWIFFASRLLPKTLWIMTHHWKNVKERSNNLQGKFSRTTSFFLHKGILLLSLMITIVIIPKKRKKKRISIPILEKKWTAASQEINHTR